MARRVHFIIVPALMMQSAQWQYIKMTLSPAGIQHMMNSGGTEYAKIEAATDTAKFSNGIHVLLFSLGWFFAHLLSQRIVLGIIIVNTNFLPFSTKLVGSLVGFFTYS